MALVVISPARQTRPVVSKRLAGHAGVRVLREDGVEDAVGDLVGHLVGMAHRDRFAGEQVTVVVRHGSLSPTRQIKRVPPFANSLSLEFSIQARFPFQRRQERRLERITRSCKRNDLQNRDRACKLSLRGTQV